MKEFLTTLKEANKNPHVNIAYAPHLMDTFSVSREQADEIVLVWNRTHNQPLKFDDYDLWLEALNERFTDGILFPLEELGVHYFVINNRLDNPIASWDINTQTGVIWNKQ